MLTNGSHCTVVATAIAVDVVLVSKESLRLLVDELVEEDG